MVPASETAFERIVRELYPTPRKPTAADIEEEFGEPLKQPIKVIIIHFYAQGRLDAAARATTPVAP